MAPHHDESAVSSSEQWGMAARNFLIGVVLSGVPILAYLWLSVDMTYGSWTAVGTSRLVFAGGVPLLCGVLAVLRGQQVIQFLSKLLESVHLPF